MAKRTGQMRLCGGAPSRVHPVAKPALNICLPYYFCDADFGRGHRVVKGMFGFAPIKNTLSSQQPAAEEVSQKMSITDNEPLYPLVRCAFARASVDYCLRQASAKRRSCNCAILSVCKMKVAGNAAEALY